MNKRISIKQLLIVLGLCLPAIHIPAQSIQDKIELNQTPPATAVTVVAKNQVVLKPGFHAKASQSTSFDAKTGSVNNVYPMIPLAAGTTAVIPTDPSTDQNYIRTSVYLTNDGNTALNTIQYFDGLGRPSQTVAQAITPTGADLVSTVQYDDAGREWKKYLPASVTGNYGQFTPEGNLNTAQSTTYPSDSRPYVETLLEASPLNRVLGEKGAGQDWEQHPKTLDYQTNDENIPYYYVNGSNQLAKGSNYDAATLYVTQTKDEDGKESYEFKDKLGQVILKRNKLNGDNVDTYYVYNDLGQLSYVIPPTLADILTGMTIPLSMPNGITLQTEDNVKALHQFAYHYRYDERGNCIYKHLPGCTPIYMVYDQVDRLAMSQDGNQRKKPDANGHAQWTVTKYDALGRVTFTGLVCRSENDSTQDYKSIRDEFASVVVNDSYTGFSAATPLTENYYDNYNFLTGLSSALTYQILPEYDKAYPSSATQVTDLIATGLLTGTRTYYLDGSPGSNTSAMYYDDKGRVVQTRSTNHLGGYDLAYNQYDFTGKVLKTLKKHKISTSGEVIELYAYSYDNGQRLKTTSYSLNGTTPITLASNSYDELGRLSTKNRHNGTEQGLSEYNIRNWPTRLKSGSFEEKLYYNKELPDGVTACYNGNIALSSWTYNNVLNKYGYTYDDLNRLKSSLYFNSANISGGAYYESFSYDKMGNINTLSRMGSSTPIDALTYSYNGNQVTKITDTFGSRNQYSVKEYQDKSNSTNEMAYDVNGNLTKDLDRDIVTIRYNVLNLPDIIQFKNGNQIKNLYDAGGHKLQAKYYTRINTIPVPIAENQIATDVTSTNDYQLTGTDYVSNYEYAFSNDQGDYQHDLDKIYNDEGYVQNLTNPQYYYFRHDHLSDNREVWLANNNTTVQRTQYYPSGLPWAYQTGDNPDLQHRKYNGKEFVEMHGYDTYDIVWRQYYPAIMRFQTPDPFAERYYDLSPYTMCGNNMVLNTDLDGKLYCHHENNEVEHSEIDEDINPIPYWNNEKEKWIQTYTAGNTNKKNIKDNLQKSDKNNYLDIGGFVVALENVGGFIISSAEILTAGAVGALAAIFSCPGDVRLDHKINYYPPPVDLPGFPGAQKVKPKAGRARWNLPNGDIGEWDSQEAEVEVYDKTGKHHKGAYDPKSGEKKKEGDPKRKTEPK